MQSALKTAETEIEILSYVDLDDPRKDDYEGITVFGPPVGSAKALLHLLGMVKTPYAMIGSDDIEFRTEGWDVKFIRSMPAHGYAIIYGSDNAKRNCNHFFFTMKYVREFGLFPDIFHHFGPDGWVAELHKLTGTLIQVPDVTVEHLHYKYGKSSVDETYLRTRSKGEGAKANELLAQTHPQRQEIATRIKKAISDFNAGR